MTLNTTEAVEHAKRAVDYADQIRERLDLRAKDPDVLATTILDLRAQVTRLQEEDRRIKAAILERAQELVDDGTICFEGTQNWLDEYGIGGLTRTRRHTFRVILECETLATAADEAQSTIRHRLGGMLPFGTIAMSEGDVSGKILDLEHVDEVDV